MVATLTLLNHKVISWNQLYSMKHWTYRKALADEIHQLIRFEACGQEFPVFTNPVKVKITAVKKSHPIDCSNINVKLYEDGLVQGGYLIDDDIKHVVEVTTVSQKGNSNYVEIEVSEVS